MGYLKLVITCIFIIAAQSSFAQKDPTYGDEFIKWVKANGRNFSTRLMEEDYASRILNIHLSHYQQSVTNLANISKKLDSISKDLRSIPLKSFAIDSVRQAIEDGNQARKSLDLLSDLLSEIEQQESMQQQMDSLGSKKTFTYSGLKHVGKEGLLESIAEIGTSLTNTLAADYSVSVTYTVSEDGTGGSVVSSATGNETLNMISTVALYGSYYYPPLAFIPVLIGTNEILRYMKKVEKQNEKVNEGLQLFEKIIPTSDEMYTIYRNIYEKQRNDFASLKKQLDSISKEDRTIWKKLYEYNVYKLEFSKSILTKAKIEQLQQQYVQNGGLPLFFNEKTLNQLNIDLNKQMVEIINLEQNTSETIETIQRLIDWENYVDALTEASAWYKELETLPLTIPIRKKLERYQSLVSSKLNTSRPEAFLQSKQISMIKTRPSNKESARSFADIIFDEFRNLDRQINQNAQKYASNENLTTYDNKTTLDPPVYIGYDKGSYVLSAKIDPSFDARYNAGGNTIHRILYGSFDGGYRTDNRAASGLIRLTAATKNINQRISELQADYSALSSVRDNWKIEVGNFNLQLSAKVLQIKSSTEQQLAGYIQQTSVSIGNVQQHLQNFLMGSVSNLNLVRFLRQSGTYQSAINNVPRSNLRVQSAPILGQHLGRMFFPASNSIVENELIRETFKLNSMDAQVMARIERNIANGSTDPIFSSVDEYKNLKMLIDQSMKFARHFSDGKNAIVKRLPMSSTRIANAYLHQVKLYKYYAQGLIAEQQFRDFSIVDGDLLASEYKILLNEFERTCNVGNAGDVASPCNRFVAMSLKSIYGIDDFMSIPNINPEQVPVVNQIYEKIVNDPKWHLIGAANNQEANNTAALMATEGRAVIAIQVAQPHGHICLILPGVPREGTGNPGYGDVKLPYAASWFLGREDLKFYYKKVSYAFGNGEGVVYYYRDPK